MGSAEGADMADFSPMMHFAGLAMPAPLMPPPARRPMARLPPCAQTDVPDRALVRQAWEGAGPLPGVPRSQTQSLDRRTTEPMPRVPRSQSLYAASRSRRPTASGPGPGPGAAEAPAPAPDSGSPGSIPRSQTQSIESAGSSRESTALVPLVARQSVSFAVAAARGAMAPIPLGPRRQTQPVASPPPLASAPPRRQTQPVASPPRLQTSEGPAPGIERGGHPPGSPHTPPARPTWAEPIPLMARTQTQTPNRPRNVRPLPFAAAPLIQPEPAPPVPPNRPPRMRGSLPFVGAPFIPSHPGASDGS